MGAVVDDAVAEIVKALLLPVLGYPVAETLIVVGGGAESMERDPPLPSLLREGVMNTPP